MRSLVAIINCYTKKAKCSVSRLQNKSDANPPEGDTKPPEGDNYGGNRQGNEQVASFLAPFREEPGASRDLALWPKWDFDP